jgi:HD-GYP domain-containing protein (c-di-GMP phosphodiesterase class II)
MNDVGSFGDPGMEMALRLRLACEAHDASISMHLDRVSRYACDIGRLMGLSEVQLTELRHATPLHDLGKIALPLEILNKVGRLTAEEMTTIKTHTVIGHRILDGSAWPVIQCAARIALSHHECWNGSGYPHRLRGEAIPLDARIVAVADVYDALMSQRAYKPAWEEDMVVAEMRRLRDDKFDPAILDLFIEHLPVLSHDAS